MAQLKIIYEDGNVLVVDKPTGVVVFEEGPASSEATASQRKTLIDWLVEEHPKLTGVGEPPRYGIVHRLDKDTSGVLLVAKTNEALIFLQKQFSAGAKALADKKNREGLEKTIEKRYIALVEGNIKEDTGTIETLIARAKGDPRKQRAYSAINAPKSAREAITEYRVLERYKDYTLLEVQIKTGRRHQIRCHFSYLGHPVAGDKMYSFKNSKIPEGLTRQFLHSAYLKIQLPGGEVKELKSELPDDLNKIIKNLEQK
ncbi:MAG: RluA family pseudouridine synthase [Candidatus Staskawiczbacteria bacterium]|nr:RluA family pseudouridine synthase [Candidatus Staskawiczbacteria bacterium]